MKRLRILGLLGIFLSHGIHAQELPSAICAKNRIQQQKTLAKITIGDPAEDHYDIQHVKMDLSVTDTSAYITGNVLTTATVVVPVMPDYVFELNNQLIIDSVKINNQTTTVVTNGDIRIVSLTTPLPQNTIFSAQVFYHGSVTPATPFNSTGIRNQTSPSWGTKVTYTLSEPYEAKDWWPTKQSLTDKIDSADMWITVPGHLKAGSNGLLKSTTPMPGNMLRYEWKTNYPIDYYLLSLAVASYVDYSFYAYLPNSSDSVLIQNYIYDNPQTLPFFKDRIDSIRQMMYFLSELYGPYPFWEEKYGNCMVPLSGGMEHQTMTSQGDFNTMLTVHELGHHWFGNHVTCGSWKDIWLNEGFASYTEYLYAEHFWTPAQTFNYMQNKHNYILMADTSSVYVQDTTQVARIFDGRFTYDKGAAIVHTLRFVFNNDSLFFQMLRDYQAQYAHGTALIPDFKTLAEQKLGRNLDTFFAQWIYSAGHPVYSASWNQTGNWVSVQLQQTSSHSSINLFHTPVELYLFGAEGDTIVRVEHNMALQTYSFYWDRPMSGMMIDPNNWLLNGFGQIVQDSSLQTHGPKHQALMVIPNPTHNKWQVQNLKSNSKLLLSDNGGKTIWESIAHNPTIDIPADHLSAGIYLLTVHHQGKTETLKLIKH